MFSAAQTAAQRLRRRKLAGLLAVAALLPFSAPLGVQATAQGDLPAIQRFAASGAVATRMLQDDLGRSSWSANELRAALVRSYGLSTTGVADYLGSPAGAVLLQRAVPWWSSDLAPQVRLAALRAAIVADSKDGSISLLGVLNALPVRFVLPRSVVVTTEAPSCLCPSECGSSSLARLAFLMACLQAGATLPAASSPTP